MTKGLSVLAIAAVVLMSSAAPAFGHHSFAAEFDAAKCQDFNGTLTGVDWANPHAYFYVDVKNAAGVNETWTFQTVSIITLKRSGTARTDFLENVGKPVYVRGCLARNGVKNRAAAETLKLPDGKLRIVGQEVEHGGRQEY
jgi:hypothetical protein